MLGALWQGFTDAAIESYEVVADSGGTGACPFVAANTAFLHFTLALGLNTLESLERFRSGRLFAASEN